MMKSQRKQPRNRSVESFSQEWRREETDIRVDIRVRSDRERYSSDTYSRHTSTKVIGSEIGFGEKNLGLSRLKDQLYWWTCR